MKALEAFLLVLGLFILNAIILAFPTMWLWNWLMPKLFSLSQIDLYEAMGVNFLSGILFKTNISIKRENNGN